VGNLGPSIGWGLVVGASLLLGAVAAARFRLPSRFAATLTAFGGGILLAAVALELVPDADAEAGTALTAAGLIGGTLVYVAADAWLNRNQGPRERMHQREMVRFHEWCDNSFTRLVTVLPNDLHDTFKMRISTGAHWPYLADPDLEVQGTLEIHEYTDTHHDNATVPHTVILSPGLKVEKTYVGYWFWGRPSADQLWLDLQEVFARTKQDFDPTVPEVRAAWEEAQKAAAPG
jgi:hypothetical protein